jgi:hypothetical protein
MARHHIPCTGDFRIDSRKAHTDSKSRRHLQVHWTAADTSCSNRMGLDFQPNGGVLCAGDSDGRDRDRRVFRRGFHGVVRSGPARHLQLVADCAVGICPHGIWNTHFAAKRRVERDEANQGAGHRRTPKPGLGPGGKKAKVFWSFSSEKDCFPATNPAPAPPAGRGRTRSSAPARPPASRSAPTPAATWPS